MTSDFAHLPDYAPDHAHRRPPGDAAVRFESFRGTGPGGQKRNKTSSSVRAVHVPTGRWAIAADHREQARNRELALQRLRFDLTLHLRQRVFLDRLQPPAGWSPAWLDLPRKDPRYLETLGHVLDVLAAAGWVVRDAADALGTTTGQLSRYLTADPDVRHYVNRMRGGVGLKPLRPPT